MGTYRITTAKGTFVAYMTHERAAAHIVAGRVVQQLSVERES